MAKMNKSILIIISAVLILVGSVVAFTAGFGYSAETKGETCASVILDYKVDVSKVDVSALKAKIAETVGTAPVKITLSVDTYTSLPAYLIRFPHGTEVDGDALVTMFKDSFADLGASKASVYTYSSTFDGSMVLGFFGASAVSIAVLFLCFMAARGFKNAIMMIAMVLHNSLLTLALCAIFRIPGGNEILSALMLTIFITAFASLWGVKLGTIKTALPVIASVAACFAIFAVCGVCFGAFGLSAYAFAMMVAATVPFYATAAYNSYKSAA